MGVGIGLGSENYERKAIVHATSKKGRGMKIFGFGCQIHASCVGVI